MMLEVQQKAPDFTLSDENDNPVSLKEYRGKDVVLYFFPKADTPGWTVEARGFRDEYATFQKLGTIILGVSADTPKKQKSFKDKFELPFHLLADVDKKVCEAYGVIKEKNMYGKKVMGIERTTFLIGPDGKIKHIFPKVKADGHAEEVLAMLNTAGAAWTQGERETRIYTDKYG
jgi:thioredoxin-dependent peroxiredoxin